MFNDEIIEWANDPFIIECFKTRNKLLGTAIPIYSVDSSSMVFRAEYDQETQEALANINNLIVEHINKTYPKYHTDIEEFKRYEIDSVKKAINENYK